MRIYDDKRVREIIDYAKEVAPFFGIIECRKIICLAEYLGIITGTEVGILHIKADGRATISKYVDIFNQQYLNGIPLKYAIQTKNDITTCKEKLISENTMKKWLQEVASDVPVKDFIEKIDTVTLFLLKNPVIPAEYRFDREINRNYKSNWTAYTLRKYLNHKGIEIAITTCTAAMRRVYLASPLVNLPEKEDSMSAKEWKAKLNSETELYTWCKNHNIQDAINSISRGNFLKERIMILTWWWNDEDFVKDNLFSCNYNKIRYKFVVSGTEDTTHSDYIGIKPKDCYKQTPEFSRQLLMAIETKAEESDMIIINRRDFLAPYVVHNIGTLNRTVYEKIKLIDFK